MVHPPEALSGQNGEPVPREVFRNPGVVEAEKVRKEIVLVVKVWTEVGFLLMDGEVAGVRMTMVVGLKHHRPDPERSQDQLEGESPPRLLDLSLMPSLVGQW